MSQPQPNDVSKITATVIELLQRSVPGSQDIKLYPAGQQFVSISFILEGQTHAFRLHRHAGIWEVREWVSDGRPNALDGKTSPRFDRLIADVLGYGDRHPTVEVREMRCPEDPRRLFGKVIVQKPLITKSYGAHLEFSCPQCKRRTGEITMHLFSPIGEYLKTEAVEPWVKREPQPWHRQPQPAVA